MEKESVSFTKWVKKQMEQLDSLDKTGVPLDESDASTDAAVKKFGLGLPVGEVMPMFVMLAAAAMWLFRLGTELAHGAQLVRELPGERRERIKCEEVQVLSPPVSAVEQSPAAARSWPEAWARGGIEL